MLNKNKMMSKIFKVSISLTTYHLSLIKSKDQEAFLLLENYFLQQKRKKEIKKRELQSLDIFLRSISIIVMRKLKIQANNKNKNNNINSNIKN